MNYDLLNNAVSSSGLKKSHICEVLGITYQGLTNKMSGKTEFTAAEIRQLSTLLNLSSSDMLNIFFGE